MRDVVYAEGMKIFLGADHRGFTLKEQLKDWLTGEGHEIVDHGATKLNQDDDYPDYATVVARDVTGHQTARGIVICGSGVGMAIAANKVPGVRAVVAYDEAVARSSRTDDDTNILSISADHTNVDTAKEIITTWLMTDFSGDPRHQRRLEKIALLEK